MLATCLATVFFYPSTTHRNTAKNKTSARNSTWAGSDFGARRATGARPPPHPPPGPLPAPPRPPSLSPPTLAFSLEAGAHTPHSHLSLEAGARARRTAWGRAGASPP